MKLPRSLVGLAGPSTPELQRTFLRDLKQAFRDRIEHQAPPLNSSINKHLQNIFTVRQNSDSRLPDRYTEMAPGAAARQLYIDGKLNNAVLHGLLTQSTTKEELETIRTFALKAGIDLANNPTNLSARYAARLLHLGCLDEVRVMIERNTKDWIATQSAHPVLLQYASRTKGGIGEAKAIFKYLLKHDERNLTTPLVRTLLRESVRADSVTTALDCLAIDMAAAAGQETGLARWLNARSEHYMAFKVLRLADPARAKEGVVGLEIARKMIARNELVQAREVLAWVEQRYALSLQGALRQLESEVARRSDTSSKTGDIIPETHGQDVQLA